MKKKEVPKVPIKPFHYEITCPSSVTDAARRFGKIATENIDQRPYKAYKYEANIKKLHTTRIQDVNIVEQFVVTPEDEERQFE